LVKDDLVDGVLAGFFGMGGANGGSLLADRFLLATGISVSGGSNPISTEIAIALGIESQDLPLGAIHFRRRRFCFVKKMRKLNYFVQLFRKTTHRQLTSNLTVHPWGSPLACASFIALAAS